MSALWEHAVDDSMLVPWHRANASRSADGWELVAVTSATGARYERYFWKRPAEDAAQGGRHCCIPWGKEGVVAALNDLGVVLRWETPADRTAFLALTRGDDR